MDVTQARSSNSIDQTEIKFLVEKNADGIIVVDEDGIVLFVNPAAEEIFGRSTHSLVGSPIGIPVLTGETTEIAIHRPGGNQIDTEIRVVETTWNHKPARLATLRDVSARRAMEERLRYSAKMEAVGRLTAGVAHEFNNLLTVVLGNLENAQRRSPLAEAPVLRALENATRGARRAAGLTERLLAFARRKPLEPRIVDLNALVSGMSDLLQRTLGEEIEVRTMLASDLSRAEVDPAELEAAILNLAVNARDAMPAGGTLVIQTSNAVLDEAYAAANADAGVGDYVLVSVVDSGTGMVPDVLKQVFEPFFTTKGGRGTGLGLSQVYGFVRQSGGHVKLYSEPGVGTTAKLYLPKAPVESDAIPESMAEAKAAECIPRGSESILVVEDDDDVRNYTAGSLRELGYEIFEAADGRSALEILEREPSIQLLFTDLGLPGGINGRALAERARMSRPSLQVVITTAYAASALIHDGRLDPGVDLLNKPFTLSALAERIREVLDRCSGQDETLRILVVEDELLVRMLVVDALADYGCQVEEAANAGEALAKFQDLGDQLAGAVIDLGLPDKPGEELIREIRSLRPDLPIILSTGYASDAVRERFVLDTQVQILPKPFDPDGMAAAFQRLGIHMRKQEPRPVDGAKP
jgi:signal transduction histidine kinase/CheY-like chemotaxis protein